jgi:hypothetical protein
MPSPFPGMDPFLEDPAGFPGFHNRFVTYLAEVLQTLLPPPYYADMEDRAWVEMSLRPIEPDVDVLRGDAPVPNGGRTAVRAPFTPPVVVRAPHFERHEAYVEIFARHEQEQIVTTIELLSPSNKSGGSEGRELYLKKQREVLQSKIHLVEIDLLRGGQHTTAVPLPLARQKAGTFDYHVCIHHFDNLEDFFVYPILLTQRLPVLAIPLLPGDEAVPLDLQAVLDRCYDAGPYRQRLRYQDAVPAPALSAERAAWVAQVLRDKGVLPAATTPPAKPKRQRRK